MTLLNNDPNSLLSLTFLLNTFLTLFHGIQVLFQILVGASVQLTRINEVPLRNYHVLFKCSYCLFDFLQLRIFCLLLDILIMAHNTTIPEHDIASGWDFGEYLDIFGYWFLGFNPRTRQLQIFLSEIIEFLGLPSQTDFDRNDFFWVYGRYNPYVIGNFFHCSFVRLINYFQDNVDLLLRRVLLL